MKKLILATTFILALSITTSFAQDKKDVKAVPQKKVESTTQNKTKLSTAKEDALKKEATKDVKSDCPESLKKEHGCTDKKLEVKEVKDKKTATEKEKPLKPIIKQRPSDHPSLQQTYPGGEHDKRVSAVKDERKEAGNAKKIEKRRTKSKDLQRSPERRERRVAKTNDERRDSKATKATEEEKSDNKASTLQKSIGKK